MTTGGDKPFFAWAGPQRGVKMLLVGEAWGSSEASCREPFVGAAGKELWQQLGDALPGEARSDWLEALTFQRFGNAWIRKREAWLHACGIAMTNVLNLQPLNNDVETLCVKKKELEELCGRAGACGSGAARSAAGAGPLATPLRRSLHLHPQYLPQLARLQSEISLSDPVVIVALGATASWALLRTSAIGAVRGTVAASDRVWQQRHEATDHVPLSGPSARKVLPTYHPAGVLRQWSWRPIVIADLMKAWREAQFREIRRPARQVLVNPTIEEVEQWTNRILAQRPLMLSADIETGAGQIKCIGFAASVDTALVVPFASASGSYWESSMVELRAWNCVRLLLESDVPKLFQNGLYDLQYLWRAGMRPRNVSHDTMLLHHSKFPEMQKGLGFLGSVYTDEASWKLMNRPKADTTKNDE